MRRWSAAMVALIALLLAGSYSVTAALGSAAGGRANAAISETAATDARTRAQVAYDAARSELATLKPTRTVGELQTPSTRATSRYPFLEAVGQHEFTLPTFHAEFQLANRTDHRRTLPSQNAPAAPTVQVFSIGH